MAAFGAALLNASVPPPPRGAYLDRRSSRQRGALPAKGAAVERWSGFPHPRTTVDADPPARKLCGFLRFGPHDYTVTAPTRRYINWAGEGRMAYSEGDGRPAMPADIRRQILVEAGHRCAIPTCRHLDVDIHHIIEWAECREHHPSNLIALCPNCHRRAHKGEIDRKSLRLYKHNIQFVHDKFSTVEVDILTRLAKSSEGAAIGWPDAMLILLGRITEAGLIVAQRPERGMFNVGGLELALARVSLSEAGREFLNDLSTKEL